MKIFRTVRKIKICLKDHGGRKATVLDSESRNLFLITWLPSKTSLLHSVFLRNFMNKTVELEMTVSNISSCLGILCSYTYWNLEMTMIKGKCYFYFHSKILLHLTLKLLIYLFSKPPVNIYFVSSLPGTRT